MIIQHNMVAETVQRNFKITNKKIRNSTEKLSSGYRINRAADDAAGLAISEKMRGQIRGLLQAERNLEDGISLIQTAEGGMNEISSIIHRQRELVIQGMNGTNTEEDKEMILMELEQLREGITEIAEGTEFNTIPLLCIPPENETITYSKPIYETIKVPIDDNVVNELQTKLKVPPVNETNGKFDFYAVNNNGTETQLLYNYQDEPTTSHPRIRVNGFTYDIWEGTILDQAPTLEDNTWVTSFGLRQNGLDLTIKQKVSVVDNPSQMAGQSYKIEYEVINNDSSTPVTFDLLYHVDTQLGSNDNAPLTVDDIEVTNNISYPRDAPIPGQVEIFDTIGNPYLNGIITINSSGGMPFAPGSEPDTLMIGQYSRISIFDDSLLDDSRIRDSGYAVIWENRTADNDSVSMTTYFGVKNPPPENLGPTKDVEVIVGYEEITVVNEIDPRLWIQSGANEGQGLWIHRYDCRAESLGLDYFSIDSIAEGESSLNKLDEALKMLSSYRATAGAEQNRLSYSEAYVESAAEQLSAAESLIRDTNMAKEMVEFTKNNIIAQATQSLLTQANQQPESILQLL